MNEDDRAMSRSIIRHDRSWGVSTLWRAFQGFVTIETVVCPREDYINDDVWETTFIQVGET